MEGLFAFVLAGLALCGSPGPATLALTATGSAFGARPGFGFLMGIGAGNIIAMSIIATGVMGVLKTLPGAAPVMTIMAAAYIIYLALRIAMAEPVKNSTNQQKPPTFIGGVFFSLVNPKAYAVWAALLSGFVLVNTSLLLDAALKIAVLFLIFSVTNTLWLLVGVGLTRFAQKPKINRAINVTFAVLLVVSVAFALLF